MCGIYTRRADIRYYKYATAAAELSCHEYSAFPREDYLSQFGAAPLLTWHFMLLGCVCVSIIHNSECLILHAFLYADYTYSKILHELYNTRA